MDILLKLDETGPLECTRCSYRGNDYENVQIHMGTVHPEYCDEMDTAGLGKLIFYQKSAKLFHCFKCFFTSKMFSNVYSHITARHVLPDKLADEQKNVLAAKIEQNGNSKSDVKTTVESSEDEKSMDDDREDMREHKMVPLKPEEGVVLSSLSKEKKTKEEESSDADSNSCGFEKQGINLLAPKDKVSNSDEEPLDFESSDNSSTYPAVSTAAASSAQLSHLPEFSDDEETVPLPKEMMDFSDNEETVPLPKEIMDFSDHEEASTLPKEMMEFSDTEETPALPKEMMEFSDDEVTPALPKDIMEFSGNEENPALSKTMEFSDNEHVIALAKDKTGFSDEEQTPSQSKGAPDLSDDESTLVLNKDLPDFSDESETAVASRNIPEFSDDEKASPLPKDIPEFSEDEEPPVSKAIPEFSCDEENTAQSKEMPDFSDDDYTTPRSKDLPEFSDNEDTSTQSKDAPEVSDTEDTSTRSKDLMDLSDTEELPTLSKDLEFSDNEETSGVKDTMIFSGIKEIPKGILSYSDSEDTSARPKGIMEFSDDEEITTFSKDIPKFSEDSISPTTPTRPDNMSEFSDNLKTYEPLKDMLTVSPSEATPLQVSETANFTDNTASSQCTGQVEMQTPARSNDVMEFAEDDTPARSYDPMKSPEDMTPGESKDASESSEEKEALTQVDTMLKYLRRGKGKYYCLMCECRPMKKGAVLHHLVGKHNIPSPYQCKDCGKNFVLENVYKNHLMSHTEGLYKCDRCNFETNHPRGFKKHQTHCQSRHSEGANKTLLEFQANEGENGGENPAEGTRDKPEVNTEDEI